jgi:hypothetical protein
MVPERQQAVTMPLRQAVWTSALAGGVLSGFLIKSPGTRTHPYWMVVLGAVVAIYVLTTLQKRRGRAMRFGQATHVASLSALVPGLVNWVTLGGLYHLVVKEAESGYAKAKLSPHTSLQQASDWLEFVKSPLGPWAFGAMTVIAFIFVAAFAGIVWDATMLMFGRRD